MYLNDLIFDKKHIWHPYTSIINPLPIYKVKSANGCTLVLEDGRNLIDGMSSWWAVIHGYNNSVINRFLNKQIKKMSHVMFGGLTHKPAIDLCRKLLNFLPKDLNCIFLSDSGSVSIEVAIKMVLQYWHGRKEPRNKFLALSYGYHGDTFGAISVCDPKNSMHNLYQGYLPTNKFIDTKRNFYDSWKKEDESNFINSFLEYHEKYNLAAVILEPIVQGVGGMRFYHVNYLKILRELCNIYDIVLIADEIATGFGRTGKMFACNYADIIPDIMCLGKSLTGGMLTLSATVTKHEIADTIDKSYPGIFMHGPTFMGNPLACTAANANLEILETKIWKSQVSFINKQMKKGLMTLIDHPEVKDVRILGAIGVVETVHYINLSNIQKIFVEQGVWIRPFRNLIYLVPPYIIKKTELDQLIQAIRDVLNKSMIFYK